MKKILVVVLTLLFSVFLLNTAKAENSNIISGGDFEGFLDQINSNNN